MRTYRGYRQYAANLDGEATGSTALVWVEVADQRQQLPMCLEMRNHSPAGFEWGYQGSGPAQLALALVVDACGPEYRSAALYQRFKERVVARLPRDAWTLTVEQVRDVVTQITSELDSASIPDVFPADDFEVE